MITDPRLRSFAADETNWRSNCFPFFAYLTVRHAAKYVQHGGNVDVVGVVTQAWQAVGVEPSDPRRVEKKKNLKELWDSDCVVL